MRVGDRLHATYHPRMRQQRDPACEILGLLSPREREVLEITAHGLTNAQVAADLNVSTHAVKFHLAAIFRKLGVSNRTQAVALYLDAQHDVATANSE